MIDEERLELNALAEQVIGACYEVSRVLGPGFLERVYRNALVKELRLRGILAEIEVPLDVLYKGEPVGKYFADILVEGKLLVELKCVEAFADQHLAQCLNYLKATNIHLALLVNFQHPKVHWKRVVHRF